MTAAERLGSSPYLGQVVDEIGLTGVASQNERRCRPVTQSQSILLEDQIDQPRAVLPLAMPSVLPCWATLSIDECIGSVESLGT